MLEESGPVGGPGPGRMGGYESRFSPTGSPIDVFTAEERPDLWGDLTLSHPFTPRASLGASGSSITQVR